MAKKQSTQSTVGAFYVSGLVKGRIAVVGSLPEDWRDYLVYAPKLTSDLRAQVSRDDVGVFWLPAAYLGQAVKWLVNSGFTQTGSLDELLAWQPSHASKAANRQGKAII